MTRPVMRAFLFGLGLFVLLVSPVRAQEQGSINVPSPVLRGIEFSVTVPGDSSLAEAGTPMVRVGNRTFPLAYNAESMEWTSDSVTTASSGTVAVEVVANDTVLREASTRAIPGWLSILPPLLAIGMALVYRVVPALFVGVWVGAVIAIGFTGWGAFKGLLDTMQVYVLGAVSNSSHAAIILFSLMIGGMVGIISKNGGTRGIVDRLTGWASDSKRGQVVTGVLGVAIFFDDYANTLIVGNTMRPVTDRLRISREKLAYIVDSTAAPISALAFVTTWIGYEVGLIGSAISGMEGFSAGAYSVFLSSLPYNFYPLLALFFVFLIAASRLDFGPMYEAEKRARETGKVLGDDANVDEAAAEEEDELKPPEGIPHRARNAVIPIVVLVGAVLAGLYATGLQAAGAEASLQTIIGEADSYKSLMWGSLLGVVVAAVLSVGQGLLNLEETVDAWYEGLKSMLFAMIILVLAWALSDVTEVLHTADYLVSVLGESLPPAVVPALIFVLAAATAFATGSSWGTMGILMPLVVPLVWAVLVKNGMDAPPHYHILYSSVSCVLAGAVWGDHCSPISDTTILSSMASGCDHIEHVRTQLPYALSVGAVAILFGTLPAGFGVPWWVGLLVGGVLLYGLLRTVGSPIRTATPPFDEEARAAES
ncbi:MAG: Na+/H+ antiporter NhaC family protein [Salinibacter sp.]